MTSRGLFTALFVFPVLMLAVGCAALPENFDKPESHAFAHTEETTLGRASQRRQEGKAGQTGFHILGNGLDAFVARAVLAQAAERSVDAQYYILHNDLTGRLFVDQLLKAADRGVRVRLLLDDLDVAGKDLPLAAIDMHPNVEIRVFNPFARNVGRMSQFVTRLPEIERRMHSKSFTADNQYAIVGGRNIGDEYFEAKPELGYTDLDVVALGPVAQQVSTAFDLYWNSELAYPISVLVKPLPTQEEAAEMRARLNQFAKAEDDSDYLRALRNSALADALRNHSVQYFWGTGEVLYDPPEKLLEERGKSARYLTGQLAPYMREVKRELIIFAPYFVPGKEGVEFLKSMRERGVRIRIITNSLASNDATIVHAGYLKYRRALVRAGVELYELNKMLTEEQRKARKGLTGSSGGSLHAKSFILDRKSVFIGSLNLDPRAVDFNTEIGIMAHAPEMAAAMAQVFDERIADASFRLELAKDENGTEQLLWYGVVDGKETVFNHEPYASLWRRFWVHLLSIFPIESQL